MMNKSIENPYIKDKIPNSKNILVNDSSPIQEEEK